MQFLEMLSGLSPMQNNTSGMILLKLFLEQRNLVTLLLLVNG
jgi:hypothetical protein